MDTKQKQFMTMMNDYPTILAHGLSSKSYLSTLVRFCEAIAVHVLVGCKTDFNTSLLNEVQVLANRTNNPVERCAVLLQHAVSNGEQFLLSFDALRKQLVIPSNILDLAEVLTRRSGESYGNHHHRLISNHIAVNLMLTELVERANITKYTHPSKEQHVRCCGLLDRAATLKCYKSHWGDFEKCAENTIIQTLQDLQAIANINLTECTDLKIVTNKLNPKPITFTIGFLGSFQPIGWVGIDDYGDNQLKIVLTTASYSPWGEAGLILKSQTNIVNYDERETILSMFRNDLAPKQ